MVQTKLPTNWKIFLPIKTYFCNSGSIFPTSGNINCCRWESFVLLFAKPLNYIPKKDQFCTSKNQHFRLSTPTRFILKFIVFPQVQTLVISVRKTMFFKTAETLLLRKKTFLEHSSDLSLSSLLGNLCCWTSLVTDEKSRFELV